MRSMRAFFRAHRWQLSYLLPLERGVWGAMERKVLDRGRSSLHQGLRLLVELATGAYYCSGSQR
jgi:hypothetical protein